MPGIDSLLEKVAFLLLVVAVVFYLARHFFFKARGDHGIADTEVVGEVPGFQVERLVDKCRKPCVGIQLYITSDTAARMVISTRDARKLASMLRIAAAPGRNLAQARWNLKRGAP